MGWTEKKTFWKQLLSRASLYLRPNFSSDLNGLMLLVAIIILWFLHRLENDGRLKWGELVVFILSDTFYQGYSQCTTIFILDLYWTTEYLTFYSAFKLISNFFIVERPLRCYFYRSLCKTIVIVFPHCLGNVACGSLFRRQYLHGNTHICTDDP